MSERLAPWIERPAAVCWRCLSSIAALKAALPASSKTVQTRCPRVASCRRRTGPALWFSDPPQVTGDRLVVSEIGTRRELLQWHTVDLRAADDDLSDTLPYRESDQIISRGVRGHLQSLSRAAPLFSSARRRAAIARSSAGALTSSNVWKGSFTSDLFFTMQSCQRAD